MISQMLKNLGNQGRVKMVAINYTEKFAAAAKADMFLQR